MKFNFCWYGIHRGTIFRLFFENFEKGKSSIKYIFKWRIAIGPLDIRKFNDRKDEN